MAAYPPAQGSLCHERSVSLQVSGLYCSILTGAAAAVTVLALHGNAQLLSWVLASLQECQSGFAPCPTSYSHAHGRLQTVMEAASTVTVAVQAPIDPYRFNMFMSDLLAERGSDIKQMHGILSIQVSFCTLFVSLLPVWDTTQLQHHPPYCLPLQACLSEPAPLSWYNVALQALIQHDPPLLVNLLTFKFCQ